MEPTEFLVSPRLVGGGDLRTRERRRLHLSRLVVRRGPGTPWECAWRFVGAKGALTWDGADQIRIEVVDGGAREGPVRRRQRRSSRRRSTAEDRVDGHFGVLSDFVAAVRSGERTGDRRPRQHPLAGDGHRRDRQRRSGPARRHRHLNGTPMRKLLDIRIGTMIRANAPDPAADVRADRRTRLREHRAVLLADDEQGPAAARQAASRGDRRRRRRHRHARHVRQPAGRRRSRPADAGGLGSADRQRPPFGAKTIAGFTGRVRGKPIERACRASRKSGANSRAAPPTKACAWRSRTARWMAIGRAATGTSPITRTPGN